MKSTPSCSLGLTPVPSYSSPCERPYRLGRTLVTAIDIAENICAPVPHRQFVLMLPKRFRLFFRFDRNLLRKLPKLARESVLEVFRAVLDRDDVVPGMVVGTQTYGQHSNWHPRMHALTTYGAFTPDDAFIPLPDDLSTNSVMARRP